MPSWLRFAPLTVSGWVAAGALEEEEATLRDACYVDEAAHGTLAHVTELAPGKTSPDAHANTSLGATRNRSLRRANKIATLAMRRLVASRRASDGAVVMSERPQQWSPSLFRVSRRGTRIGVDLNRSSWSVDRPKIFSKTPTIRGVAARKTPKDVGNQQYSHVQRRVVARPAICV